MSNEPKLNKYILVTSKSQANEFVELGYKLHTFTTQIVENHMVQEYWVMSLSSDGKYDNIINLRDVAPEQVDGYLAMGWQVADSWSKIVRVVKKAESI